MTLTNEQKEALNDPFPIVCLYRADIRDRFNLTEQQALNIDDNNMCNIARKMSEAYCDRIFWIDLDVLAEEVVKNVKL